MNAEIFSYGAAEEVTGSKHFFRLDNRDGDRLIMVDCGAFQGRRAETEEKNRNWRFSAGDVDAVVLTHAHYDHSGLTPLLQKKGFRGNIYATPASRDLASLIMMDSAHIQAKDLEYLKKKAGTKGESFDKTPLYTEEDVVESLKSFVTVSYKHPFVPAQGIRATFYDAGHILGSAIALFEIQAGAGSPRTDSFQADSSRADSIQAEGLREDTPRADTVRVAFSGDLGRKNLPIIRDPETLPPVDYLVMESTYGNRNHDPIDIAKEKLAEVVNRTVNRGGKIVIPAFAVERTQELVYFLHLLRDEGRIPKIPAYVDSPMAVNATSIFRVHQECYDEETRKAFLDHHENPFGFSELRYVVSTEESKSLNTLRGPAIIISSSGMCESGRILHHLVNTIENPRNTVLIVGFMAQNTLGRKLLEGEPKVSIFGDPYRVKAEVSVMNAFSAHADSGEIIEYIGRLDRTRLREIFLVHGEADSQSSLKALLESRGYRTTIVRYGERYRLDIP